MPEFSFWGVTCAPLATPSETCLPHRLRITRAVCCAQARSPRFAAVTGPSSTCLQHARPIRAMQVDLRVRGDAWQTLDPAQAANLKPGTRVTIWATQKMRPEQRSGALHPVQAKRSLVALLVSAQRESVGTNLFFSSSSLLSFSVSPKSQACAVHLAGYFDHSSDAQPEQVDDGSITWAELQELLANARGQNDDDAEDDGGAAALAEMRKQVQQLQTAGTEVATADASSPDHSDRARQDPRASGSKRKRAKR